MARNVSDAERKRRSEAARAARAAGTFRPKNPGRRKTLEEIERDRLEKILRDPRSSHRQVLDASRRLQELATRAPEVNRARLDLMSREELIEFIETMCSGWNSRTMREAVARHARSRGYDAQEILESLPDPADP